MKTEDPDQLAFMKPVDLDLQFSKMSINFGEKNYEHSDKVD